MNDWLKSAPERINAHRKGDLSLRVLAGGKPAARCPLRLIQKKSRFRFGSNFFQFDRFDSDEKRNTYRELFKGLFNYATLPFYWGTYEAEKGKTQEKRLHAMAAWCLANDIAPKGHPLVWHTVVPKWLDKEKEEDIEGLVIQRLRDIIGAFRDEIKWWDIYNEITVAKDFDNPVGRWGAKTGVQAVEIAVRTVLEKDPTASLIVNDYNVWKDDSFAELLARMKDKHLPIKAVGIQSHMHEHQWTLEETWNFCEKYAAFGWPLHFTEISVLSGKCNGPVKYGGFENEWIEGAEYEIRQEQVVKDFYTLLFSHPKVEAITWWDLNDGMWLKAPSGLVRRDLSPKPAYHTLKDLIQNQWMTRTEGETDPNGRFEARVFYGDYEVSVSSGSKMISKELSFLKNQGKDFEEIIQL
jgi:endo-1,4-beta-xylanase